MELQDGPTLLRRPADSDAPALAAAVAASLDALAPWMPWAKPGYDEADALAWIRSEYDATEVGFVIVDDGEVVGTCGLNRVDAANRSANLGYWLMATATGRGHATTATRLVARHGVEALGLERLEIVMSVENEPSRRVAERAGAHYEGVLRACLRLHDRQHDAHIWSIVRGDACISPAH